MKERLDAGPARPRAEDVGIVQGCRAGDATALSAFVDQRIVSGWWNPTAQAAISSDQSELMRTA